MALKLVVDSLDSVDEPLRALYAEKDGKFHLGVEGVEDTSGLKSALQKERDAAKAERKRVQELEERFKDIDPDKVRSLFAKIDQDGEAQLIADGKIDEVVNKRTAKQQAEFQKKIDAIAKELETEKARGGKFRQRVLDDSVRDAAAKAGMHTYAVEDALIRARSMFTVDADGNAFQPDEDGNPILGKDGKTPFGPLEWLEDMKDKAPHWFPAGSTGGAAPGSKDPGTGGKRTMKRAVWNALSATEKAAASKNYVLVD